MSSLCCCCTCLICAEDMERRNCQVGAATDAMGIVAGVATARAAHSRKAIAVVSRDVMGMKRVARDRGVT